MREIWSILQQRGSSPDDHLAPDHVSWHYQGAGGEISAGQERGRAGARRERRRGGIGEGGPGATDVLTNQWWAGLGKGWVWGRGWLGTIVLASRVSGYHLDTQILKNHPEGHPNLFFLGGGGWISLKYQFQAYNKTFSPSKIISIANYRNLVSKSCLRHYLVSNTSVFTNQWQAKSKYLIVVNYHVARGISDSLFLPSIGNIDQSSRRWSILPHDHGLSQQGAWVPLWTPKPLKRTPQDTQFFCVWNFVKSLIIPMTLFNDIMPYFDEFIHVYGWNMSILWSPLKIWTPKNFTTANFRHPVSKSWLRHCSWSKRNPRDLWLIDLECPNQLLTCDQINWWWSIIPHDPQEVEDSLSLNQWLTSDQLNWNWFISSHEPRIYNVMSVSTNNLPVTSPIDSDQYFHQGDLRYIACPKQ